MWDDLALPRIINGQMINPMAVSSSSASNKQLSLQNLDTSCGQQLVLPGLA